ncbi:stage IV sporulation protein FA [Terribacillus aidingensis]|uniref:Stage IV sporulation protein FA n=1 Tax=Terribacillus aidingensis TaxID=586416 RepID=A0A285NQ44_9BACI|nr:M23 family metallopeptidase [Terribacillus aidingensis]SNZ11338.1 stage IV sporulation protein FA [Terribacillus aidingensis]
MGKNLHSVRKGIADRKRLKGEKIQKGIAETVTPFTIEEEESHGFGPNPKYEPPRTEHTSKFAARFMFRLIVSATLFFGTALYLQADHPFVEKTKATVITALTEEFPFATVNSWYQDRFGDPVALKPGEEGAEVIEAQAMPVNGTVVQPFDESKEGILIESDQKSDVVAVDEGIVIFAGNDRDTGKTIILQHADKSKSIYGHLQAIEVNQYQRIDSNEKIGEFVPNEENAQSIYFALQQGNKFLNPIQEAPVDAP